MDKTAATALATRLHEQLGGKVLRVRAEQVNPYSGHGDIGWAARVVKEDGEVVDVIGNETAGYQTTDSTLGWLPLDLLVAAILVGEADTSDAQVDAGVLDDDSTPAMREAADDLPLVERVTALAAGLVEMGRELAAVRDELVLRGVQ